MDCPHVEECVVTKSCDQDKISEYVCSVCKTNKSVWMCLACGVLSCGRYINGHAIDHFQCMNKRHAVCFDCENFAVFCYSCDDFVVNDTTNGDIAVFRKKFQEQKNGTTNENCGIIGRKRKRQMSESSSASNDCQITDGSSPACKAVALKRCSGLRNLGNTCFMNAVLQSLSNIDQFRGFFKKLPEMSEKSVSKRNSYCTRSNNDHVLLSEEVRKILLAQWGGSKSSISPDSLFSVIWKVVPRFRGYQQQDAHEFLRYMLDRLHTELVNVAPNNGGVSSSEVVTTSTSRSSVVTSLFSGVLQNEVKCLVCGTESKKHDPFLDLSLDVPLQFTSKSAKKKDGEPVCCLADCLSSFTELEELSETELYYCTSCKRRERSTKKFWIRRLPNVLCLHLKRFRWVLGHRQKLETFVEFPLTNLDMSPYLLENLHETRGSYGSTTYDLAAVVVHHGSGAGSGHYTAFATHEGNWFHFNDHSVKAVDVSKVTSAKGYILFYVKQTCRSLTKSDVTS